MTYIIALPCVDLLDKACIEECPVDCIYEGNRMLYIHPDECVDCGACEPVCPVEAIFSEEDIPQGQQQFKQLNAELAKKWPVISEMGEAPADAKQWEGVPDKLKYLER